MPFIPLPGGGRMSIRLAALTVLLLVVVVLSPALLLWSLLPSGRSFVLQLLAELRIWTADLVGNEPGPGSPGAAGQELDRAEQDRALDGHGSA